MIHVTEEQVLAALDMPTAMDLVEQAVSRMADGISDNHPRRRVQMRNRTLLHYMAAGDNQIHRVGLKAYASNPAVGAPNFVVLLFNSETAGLLATIDANHLGQIRTGAASGVATRWMARKDATRLAVFGSGFQAATQLEAVACARDLERVHVYSRSQQRREAFAARMSDRLDLDVRATESPEEALEGADIVITVTNAREPVFDGNSLPQGAHINAAGSNHAKRREIDSLTVERSAVVAVDSLAQAKMEAGDLIQAVDDGKFDWASACELHEILNGVHPGRKSEDHVTLFESQGLAIEDIAVAEHLYQHYK